MLTRFFIIFLFFTCQLVCFGQEEGVLVEKSGANSDTARVNYLNRLGWDNKFTDIEKASDYTDRALKLSQQLGYEEGIAASYNNFGIFNDLKGNYAEALKFHIDALAIRQKLGNQANIATSLNNLAAVYKRLNEYDQAIANYQSVIGIMQSTKNRSGLAIAYNNLGSVYQAKKDFRLALINYEQSLSIKLEIKDPNLAGAYYNIGNIALETGNYPYALKNLKASLKLMKQSGSDYGVGLTLFLIGQVYEKQRNLKVATFYYEGALANADNEQTLDLKLNCLKALAKTSDAQRAYERAFYFESQFLKLKDSSRAEAGRKRLNEISARLDAQQKANQLAYLEQTRELDAQELQWQNRVVRTLVILLIILGLLGALLYNRYLVIKKTNIQLERKDRTIAFQREENFESKRLLKIADEQKNEIEAQKVEIEKINRQLTGAYRKLEQDNNRKTAELEIARELQMSILPATVPSYPGLEIAVYMKTATEVGGDYYDFYQTADGKLQVVLGDATGHGLKAAFLVAVAKSYFQFLAPSAEKEDLFRQLSQGVAAMNLSEMYLAFSLLEYYENQATLIAASMPPVYVLRGDTEQIDVFQVDGMFLGSPLVFPYEKITFELFSGDTVVMMSDGLPELSNPDEDMIGYDKVLDYLQEVGGLSAEDIVRYLAKKAAEWVEDSPYDDDVTLVVFRVL